MKNQKVLEKVEGLFDFLKGIGVRDKFLLFHSVGNNLDKDVDPSYTDNTRTGILVQILSRIYPLNDIIDVVLYCSEEDCPDEYAVYTGFEVIVKEKDGLRGYFYQIFNKSLYFDKTRIIE